ncbi:MAG TPA: HlyD family secretion protein [Verrucomicrobiae bacterium]|jgi:membrane fusion protein (multidrug efflux system)|nr:HlyD family secretion protein [Verrucomicrobiae bacterium]
MSPTTAKPDEVERPAPQGNNREEHHDPEARQPEEDRRGFFQKHPAAKPVVFLVAIVAVVLVGWFWWESRQWEDTDDAEIDGHIYPISARINGHVIKVNFDDGQIVHQGDVLVVVDPTDYTVALERARADYQDSQAQAEAARYGVPVSSVGSFSQIHSASADLDSAQAGVAAAQKQMEAAQSQVIEAQADAQKLNTDVLRYQQLLGKREISQQQFDAATAAATAANATVQARQSSLLAAQAQVKMAQSRIEQANAEVKNAQATPNTVAATKAKADSADAQALRSKAALDQAQLNLSYTTITAPVDGIVGKRSVQVGSNVAIGQDLMAIVPLRDVWVTANFKETQLAHMRPGQPVKISVDTYGGRKWDGHVSNVGGATGAKYSLLPPENATGNYVKVVQRIPVRIDFDGNDKPDFNKDGLLRPGMSVEPDVKVR